MNRKPPLKILVVTQYFWPENSHINYLVDSLADKGHQVTVLTGVPNYPHGEIYKEFETCRKKFSRYKGIPVVRVPMFVRGKKSITLALNYVSFFINASILGCFKLHKNDFDIVFVYAVSPIMVAIPGIFLGKLKKASVFVWVLDLWPETLRAVGVIRNRGLLNIVGKCVSWIYDRTDYLLVQSKSFVENIRQYSKKSIEDERVVYFPQWAEKIFFEKHAPSNLLIRDDSVFTVVFAGGMGDAQDFPSILLAAERLKDRPVRWVIVGDGRSASWVIENVRKRRLDNVSLLGKHPLEKMPALFAAADCLLVSLKTDDVFSKIIPNKVQAYLASGRPIIAMLAGEGEKVVRESGAGKTCAPGDVSGLVGIVEKMIVMPKEQRDAMGRAGREFCLKNFSKDDLVDKLEKYFYSATLRKT